MDDEELNTLIEIRDRISHLENQMEYLITYIDELEGKSKELLAESIAERRRATKWDRQR